MYELTRLARGGVLLTGWALAAGWPRGRLGRRLHGDGWQRICRGAWAVPGKEVDWRVRARALQLLRPDLVCSHGTAAALHRIELLTERGTDGPGGGPEDGPGNGEVLEFTSHAAVSPRAPHQRRPAPGRISPHVRTRVRTTSVLADRDCSLRQGLRVTNPARTAGDLIRTAGSREAAVVVADSALSRRLVGGLRRGPLVRSEDLAAELAVPRRAGGPAARRWLPLAVPGSGSPAETVARLRMRDADLHPEVQPTLRTRAGRPLHPDFLFRAAGLVVEIEGFAYHGTREAHARDVHRFNELQNCPGVRRVLRFTAREVFARPDRMTATIRAALADCSGPDPAGPHAPRA
ncbi:endonuclease domain-containing protein [Streptomyces sp. NPDC101158]|uniref:endonuclease domain-containing protein n=1 Tax=Streptomyces sp. NPDC101158 TaxID=3366117 RepID=UPI0038205A5C